MRQWLEQTHTEFLECFQRIEVWNDLQSHPSYFERFKIAKLERERRATWRRLYRKIRYYGFELSSLDEQEICLILSDDQYLYPATLQGMRDAINDVEHVAAEGQGVAGCYCKECVGPSLALTLDWWNEC